MRTYQLLISPSVVAYLIREQFYSNPPPVPTRNAPLWVRKLQNTLYLLSLREFYLDRWVFRLFFYPLKKIQSLLQFITLNTFLRVFLPLYIVGLTGVILYPNLPVNIKNAAAIFLAFVALAMAAKAFNEQKQAKLAWVLVVGSHFFTDLAVTFNDHFDAKEAIIYLNGIVVSGLLGYIVLKKIETLQKQPLSLAPFQGLISTFPKIAPWFFLACLGLAGFPITTTFFREDLILTHIKIKAFWCFVLLLCS